MKSTKKQILVLTSYPPRQCGIATFSSDLINAIQNKFGHSFSIKVCALDEKDTQREYPDEVIYTLQADQWKEYVFLAQKINSNTDIHGVFIQHEFGLFSGKYGENLLFFLHNLNKPVSITFHTLLPGPDVKRRNIVQAIAREVKDIVVMTKRSAKLLTTDYGVNSDIIHIIPHGTHSSKWIDREKAKKRFGLQDKLVVSTFGLLSPNKSIETAIEALPSIIEKFPNVLYLILGRTHPGIIAHKGETYREYLVQKVKELGIENNIRFVNKYLDLEELLDYLHLSDIYLFTSGDPLQAVSGTFAYAMSSGCPVISTRIPHSEEILIDECGYLIDIGDAEKLSEYAIHLLSNPQLRSHMGHNAFQHTRSTTWDNVAIMYAKLLARQTKLTELEYDWPAVSLQHIKNMTDSTGIIQFSDICEPDISSGYTLDDNARALISLCLHYKITAEPSDLLLIQTYLNFIIRCQMEDGKFLNYIDEFGGQSEKNNYVNLEDSNGRTIWALGQLISHGDILPENILLPAEITFVKTLNWIPHLKSPRAISFAIKGLYAFKKRINLQAISLLINDLSAKLSGYYDLVHEDDWQWFEARLTYANAVIPEAMLLSWLETGDSRYRAIAKKTFDFLLSKLFRGGMIRTVSNRGWMDKGKPTEEYGEQPIDVAYTIIALDLFRKVFPKDHYEYKMLNAFNWFLGRNHLNQVMYNSASGGCFDGLEEHNVNINQGAESSICYLISRLTMELYKKELSMKQRISKLGVYKKTAYSEVFAKRLTATGGIKWKSLPANAQKKFPQNL